jgi:hypothetical protein
MDIRKNIEGANVLIVEDILDTGRTLHYLIELLRVGELCCLCGLLTLLGVTLPFTRVANRSRWRLWCWYGRCCYAVRAVMLILLRVAYFSIGSEACDEEGGSGCEVSRL